VQLTVVGLLYTGLLFFGRIFLTSCVLFYCTMCTAVLHTLVAGLLARSQYPEGPATGRLDTGSSWFPSI
jgi:Na+/melibiose symporter-like transporter